MTKQNKETPPTLLLVEDNPGDVLLIEEALQETGSTLRLRSVLDGEAALALLRQEGAYADVPTPDLVLLDLNLPRMDGHEVLSQIRSDERLQAVPVIVLTTSEAPEDVQRAYGLHANAYVTKPVDLDALFRMMETLEHFWFSCARLPDVGERG